MMHLVAPRPVLMGLLCLFATASVVGNPAEAPLVARESAAQNAKVTPLMTKELAGLAATSKPLAASWRQASHCPLRKVKPSNMVSANQKTFLSRPRETPGMEETCPSAARRASSMVTLLINSTQVLKSKIPGRRTGSQS